MTHTLEREYVLGTGDDELARLSFQHEVWRPEMERTFAVAGFAPGQTILDLGCGPGLVTSELARIAGPDGRIIGVDVSARFINHLNAVPREGDAAAIETHLLHLEEDDLPFAADSLDGIYARWVFTFVRDPAALLRKLRPLLKPRGVIAIQDYGNWAAMRLVPESPAFGRFMQAAYAATVDGGGDVDVAMRLPRDLIDAGFEVERIEPIQRIGRPGGDVWRWCELYQENFGSRMIRTGHWTQPEYDACRAEWARRAGDPAAFLMSPPMQEIIARAGAERKGGIRGRTLRADARRI